MIKIIVNAPTGEQKIEVISQSGQYFDAARVVFDERKDGNIPSNITLGKMKRNGKLLDTLPDYLPEHAAWMLLQQAEIDDSAKKKQLETDTKGDGDLALLRKMNGDEINAWFDLNVTNTNQCIKMLKKVFKSLVKQNLL